MPPLTDSNFTINTYMKKTIICVFALLFLGASPAMAFDLKDLAGKVANGGNSEQSDGPTSMLGGLLSSLIANDNFNIDDLAGTWSYVSPAVSFKSENALQNIGGVAAAEVVEEKLAPYYKRLGFSKTTLTVDEEHNFQMQMGLLKFAGTVEKNEDKQLVFNFTALGKKLASVNANATKSGNSLNVTFDADKLIKMLSAVSNKLNAKTLTTITDLLNSYDDIYMGFTLNKTSGK